MNDNAKNSIVCMRVDSGITPVPSSRLDRCSVCSKDVYVAASSLMAAGADAILFCLSCASDLIQKQIQKGQPIPIMPPTEAQLRECRERGSS